MKKLTSELLNEIKEIENDTYLSGKEKVWAYEDVQKAAKGLNADERKIVEDELKAHGLEIESAPAEKVTSEVVTNQFNTTYLEARVNSLEPKKAHQEAYDAGELFAPRDLKITAYEARANTNRPIVAKAKYTNELGDVYVTRDKAYSIKTDKLGRYISYNFSKEFKPLKVYLKDL